MKLNKIVLPLALALMAALATTGCKHGFNGKVTNLPGHRDRAVDVGGGPGNTLPPGNQLPMGMGGTGTSQPFPGTGAGTQPGGGPTSDQWDPSTMHQDRDKLAAYTVHFKYDSAVVQDNEQANVANVGQALGSNPEAKLLIEGHCDERGTEEYNRALGERRALALRESLSKIGIDPMRIRTISYGKDQPKDPGHDEAAWAKNRRGEFVYCTPNTPVQ
jgi:peptidoglycan-associated lipoprotein